MDHLDRLGLLSPRLTVAHGVHLTEEECTLLAKRQVTVSVNTSSNLRLRSGVAPVSRFRRTGLGFGLGLDGMSFDDSLRDVAQHTAFTTHTPVPAGQTGSTAD
ncbi:MAG: amidohydrolase family protein [Nitrospiraceae bacterium]|nr:amidohydrolase family protein [Nitrospiraceae bacterium]